MNDKKREIAHAHATHARKPYALRLGAMAAAYQEQQRDAQIGVLSFEERFSLLIDAEHVSRDNRQIKALLKDAELRIPEACIENVGCVFAARAR